MNRTASICSLETFYRYTNGGYPQCIKDAIDALEKIERIKDILNTTDFQHMESLNEYGEDFGWRESLCEISILVDGKERWLPK